MKKLMIFTLFLVMVSLTSCTKEPLVDNVQTDIELRGAGFDPNGMGPGIEPH